MCVRPPKPGVEGLPGSGRTGYHQPSSESGPAPANSGGGDRPSAVGAFRYNRTSAPAGSLYLEEKGRRTLRGSVVDRWADLGGVMSPGAEEAAGASRGRRGGWGLLLVLAAVPFTNILHFLI